MHVAVYLLLVFPALAAVGARPIGDRLSPKLATWALTVAAAVLAIGSTAALAFLVLAGVAQLPISASIGHYSIPSWEQETVASLVVTVVAASLLAAATVSAGRGIARRTRALLAVAFETVRIPTDERVIVEHDDGAEAYAMPGPRGRIVVSTGMLAALDPFEQEVLLAHERAHLRHNHHLFVAVADSAAAANPLLRPLARAVGYQVERWADERAAAVTGNRTVAAVAVGKAALASAARRRRTPLPAFALGIGGRTRHALRSAGPIPRRVAALLAPPMGAAAAPVVASAIVLLAVGVCGLEAATDLEALLAALTPGP